eukprot:2863074-Prymnesium_polylepis.2
MATNLSVPGCDSLIACALAVRVRRRKPHVVSIRKGSNSKGLKTQLESFRATRRRRTHTGQRRDRAPRSHTSRHAGSKRRTRVETTLEIHYEATLS